MATLKTGKDHDVLDAKGHAIKKGAMVVDDILGEGIADGVVPLADGSGGVNVVIKWLGDDAASKPKSRGAEHLTLVQDMQRWAYETEQKQSYRATEGRHEAS